MSARFEAVFYDGEPDERLPEWHVVEWTYVNPETGAKCGNKVAIFSEYDGDKAIELAAVLQHEYNMEFHAEFG